MNDGMTAMIELLRKADALKPFLDAVVGLRNYYFHDLAIANDTNAMHAIRGQISICNTFADNASAALESDEAKAKAEFDEGIPR